MKNVPLTNSDYSKLLFFVFLLAPSLFYYFVGVIPAVYLAFGVFMMHKNKDFIFIDIAMKRYKFYCYALSAALAAYATAAMLGLTGEHKWRREEEFLTYIFLALLPLVSIKVTNFLFYKPLFSHSEWVSVHGVFNTKKTMLTSQMKSSTDSGLVKSTSIASELEKLSKLKNDGHISEEEFIDAKNKILK